MPRTGRKHSATGIYHVMLRGINRQDIFEEPEDYWEFIRILFLLYNTFFLKDGGTPKVACLFFLISIAIFFSFMVIEEPTPAPPKGREPCHSRGLLLPAGALGPFFLIDN